MARLFGSITETHGGRDLTLVLDFNAVCHFNGATGLNFLECAQQWQEAEEGFIPDPVLLRAVVHAALQKHHGEIGTVDLAGDLLSQDTDVISRLFAAMQQGVEEADSAGKNRAAAR